jgi:hypothetical protein
MKFITGGNVFKAIPYVGDEDKPLILGRLLQLAILIGTRKYYSRKTAPIEL